MRTRVLGTGGGAAAALALLALTVDETDEAFANVYSSAVSTQNVLSRVPQRALIACAQLTRSSFARVRELMEVDIGFSLPTGR